MKDWKWLLAMAVEAIIFAFAIGVAYATINVEIENLSNNASMLNDKMDMILGRLIQ